LRVREKPSEWTQFKRSIQDAFRSPWAQPHSPSCFRVWDRLPPATGPRSDRCDSDAGSLGAFLLIAIFDRSSILGLAVDQGWLTSLLILDLVAFIYHVWAIVDSYRVASNAGAKKRRGTRQTTSMAAVVGVVVLLSGTVFLHAGVAKVDSDWQHALYCLTAKVPCWVTDKQSDRRSQRHGQQRQRERHSGPGRYQPAPEQWLGRDPQPIPLTTWAACRRSPRRLIRRTGTADGELNVLLMGLGVQKGNNATQLGPDTIMVMHVG